MGELKIEGGPRDGGTYKAPDGYREYGYFGEIKLPYNENGQTKFAIYERKKKRDHRRVIVLEDKLIFVRIQDEE